MGSARAATAVYVVYDTPALDVSWIPNDVPVVVVHNDAALDRRAVGHRDVTHVEAPGNVGFGAAVNLALPLVDSDRVVLCNPDVALESCHWHALTEPGPEVVVTVPLTDDTGELTSVCSRYPTPLSHLASGWRVGRWLRRGSPSREVASRLLGRWGTAHVESLRSPVGTWPLRDRWISGAVFSVDTDVLRSLGGFDESFFLYYEDVDLCRRLASIRPAQRATVAATAPGRHGVGASAASNPSVVERVRLESAIRYADGESGAAWRACAHALRFRRWLLR